MKHTIEIRWGTSRARSTYGYTTCTLYEDGVKRAKCCGGGYDLKGTVLGDWVARTFADRLRKLHKEVYGLTWHDPKFDASTATVPGEKGTVAQREAAGESLGLERYQAIHRASSKVPTARHTVPRIDGACGWESVVTILEGIGAEVVHTAGNERSSADEYEIDFAKQAARTA